MTKVVCVRQARPLPVIIKCECASRERGYRVDIHCLSLVQLFRLFLLRAGCLVRTYTVEVVVRLAGSVSVCARYLVYVARREHENEA